MEFTLFVLLRNIYWYLIYGIHRFKLLVNCQLIIYIVIQDIYTISTFTKKNLCKLRQGERGK